MRKQTLRLQATGFLLDIPRVEVLINSSRLSSKLKVDVKLLPIKAVLETTTGMHDAQLLHQCSMAILMCCAMLLVFSCRLPLVASESKRMY